MDRKELNELYFNIISDLVDSYESFKSFMLNRTSDFFLDIYGNDLDDPLTQICEERNIEIDWGATKVVLIFTPDGNEEDDYVVKIPFVDRSIDYCEREVENYNEVPDSFKGYFAECWKGGEIEICNKKIPFYIMEKVDANEGRVMDESFHYFINEGGNSDDYDPYDGLEEVSNCFALHYGYTATSKIIEYLDEANINDIHTANIGYRNDYPVLIDYSGYFG